MQHALILVDIQRDFLPGGALAVPKGDAVVSIANLAMKSTSFDMIVATKDWHPADHRSFASQHEGRKIGEVIEWKGLPQVLWPDHCVQNTPGADFPAELNTARIAKVIFKGTLPDMDSYSGFFDNGHIRKTGLEDWLKEHQVTTLSILGLATDYCVKFTVLDACDLGFAVRVIREGIRGVELKPGDCENAIREMQDHGAEIISIQDI